MMVISGTAHIRLMDIDGNVGEEKGCLHLDDQKYFRHSTPEEIRKFADNFKGFVVIP